MTKARSIALGALLAIASHAAVAFQETKSGSQEAAPKLGPAAPNAGLSQTPDSRQGPEIKVPGIGTIGNLPKLDFGLELLYGASNQPPAGPSNPADEKAESGAQIRGTLKYRFPN